MFSYILTEEVTCAFFAYKKQWRNSQKIDVTFHIFDQIKVLMIPLLIGHSLYGGSLEITLTVP